MAAVYAFFISVFVYRDLQLKDVPKTLLNAAAMSAMLLYIITNAVMFSFLLTSEQIPQAMAAWMTVQGFGLVAFLLVGGLADFFSTLLRSLRLWGAVWRSGSGV